MISNRFRSVVLRSPGAVPLGCWVSAGSPTVAEALGYCGFDFRVVDMEHSALTLEITLQMLRALAGTPVAPLVRLAWNDQVRVKQVLDAGATSLMFPFVQTAEQARAAVAFTRYPPQGVRGVASMHRGSRYASTPNYLRTANDALAVVVQLETPAAIEQLEAIAAVPGVDSLFVGPADLAAALGHIGDPGHERVQRLIACAATLARAAGRPIGIIGSNPQAVGQFVDYGYTWAAISSDLSLKSGRARECFNVLRERGGAVCATRE